MKEPYGEGLASHADPESCMDSREAGHEALIRGTCRRGIEPRNIGKSGCPRCLFGGKATLVAWTYVAILLGKVFKRFYGTRIMPVG
jgi:hypothetical protein